MKRHLQPRSHLGTFLGTNLIVSHFGCNLQLRQAVTRQAVIASGQHTTTVAFQLLPFYPSAL